MLTVLRIPPPPMPGEVLGLAVGLGALLVGLFLLMAGRHLWRILSAAALAGAGLALAPWAATLAKISPIWMMLILAVALGLLGVLLARMFWGVVFAGLLAAAAALGVIHMVASGQVAAGATPTPAGFDAAGLALSQWAEQMGGALGQWGQWLLHEKNVLSVGLASLGACIGLLLGLVCPLFTRIFLSSVLGAGLAVGGVAAGILAIRQGYDFSVGYRPWILLGIGGLLWLIGFSYQYRGHHRAEAQKLKEAEEKEKKEAAEAKEQSKTPAKK